MQCWNCCKEIPEGAKSCGYCESKQNQSPVANADPAEAAKMLGVLKAQIGEEGFAELEKVFGDAESFDEVSAAIFSGECPKCGSAKTETCDEVAGIENILVGRCKECCTLYCTDCGRIFQNDVITESTPLCPACGGSNTDFGRNSDGIGSPPGATSGKVEHQLWESVLYEVSWEKFKNLVKGAKRRIERDSPSAEQDR